MKILHCCESFCAPTLTFVYNTVLSSSKAHDVKVLCFSRLNEEKFPFDNVHEIKYDFPEFIHKVKFLLKKHFDILFFFNRKLKKGIDEFSNTFNPDIIHIHFGLNALRYWANFPEEWKKKTIVIHFHGYDASPQMLKSNSYVKSINNLFLKKNIHPVFVSNDMKQRMIEKIKASEKGDVLYYGIDIDFFEKNEAQFDTKQNIISFLQISSFREKKGHIYTIKAFKKLVNKRKDVQLILAGDGPLIKQIQDLVSELGLNKFVFFEGLIDKYQAKKLLETSSFFIHHSITANNGDTEGLPNALIEAMLMNLPIISTYHAGIPELVEHNVNGFLVKEKDIDNMAFYMNEICDWPKQTINREKAIKLFSLQVHAEQLENIYKKYAL